jgi:hypothetical protein
MSPVLLCCSGSRGSPGGQPRKRFGTTPQRKKRDAADQRPASTPALGSVCV